MRGPSKPSIPKGVKGKRRRVGMSYWIYRIMKEMGWTVKELKECPLPTFFMIIDEIKKENEEQ